MAAAWCWVKNSTGSAITCQRKRLTMTTESLVCSLSNSDCRTNVNTARTSAVNAMPISNGMSQLLVCWIRMWSMKILENPAATIAGTTSARLTTTSSPTAVDRGIVEVDVATVDTFQHHEMVEVPVDDAGHRQFMQRRGFFSKTLGVEAEGTCRPDDVARLAAVARDAAGDTELLQRDPGAVVGEHHRQRRGAALDGFHLQDGGRPLDVPAPEQPAEPVPNRWRPGRPRHP